MKKECYILFIVFLLLRPGMSAAQKAVPADAYKKAIISNLNTGYSGYKEIAHQIWDYAELGYKEQKSTALLQKTLSDNGFTVQAGIAGIPTSFVATYGSGKPVIGILAEFDALPGLSQQASPERAPIVNEAPGHGCGHHLFGTASVAAAIEIKKLIEQKKISGTIKLFGTAAEEGGSGKVYLVKAGLFNDVDAVLHWHPGSANAVTSSSSLADISIKFRFHGIAAHAAASPDKGRSALDAVEVMNYSVNMMREHIPSETRIHYIITHGGKAPNIVPDFAESFYTLRNPSRAVLQPIIDRVIKAGEGAALATGTTMDYEIIAGEYELLINKTLASAMQKNLETVGGVKYTPEEVEFGKKLQTSFLTSPPPIESAASVKPLGEFKAGGTGSASTDVGDVTWVVPTVGLGAATFIPGTPGHSWQAVACGGTEIGTKGMLVAAKTIALTGVDLFTSPSLLLKAKEEFKTAVGSSFTYKALVGDRTPPFNYRDF
jgi:aminobenzoyl-glutamate utilization protein B